MENQKLEDKLDKLIELQKENKKSNKGGVLENINGTAILQVLIISGIIGFIGNYVTTNKQNIIQEEYNKQQQRDMESLKKDLSELTKNFTEFSQIERYTKIDAEQDLRPIILKVNSIEERLLKRERWEKEREEAERKMEIEISILKQLEKNN